MFLFNLPQKHQRWVYFLVWNILIFSLNKHKNTMPHCQGCYNRKSHSRSFTSNNTVLIRSQKTIKPWMVIHIPALYIILLYIIQMIFQTSITLWAAPTEIISIIKIYSPATNKHRRSLLIITLIIAIILRTSLILLHSTAFIGVHNPAVVVNTAAAGKINILEVVSLLKKVLQKTPPWNMETKHHVTGLRMELQDLKPPFLK